MAQVRKSAGNALYWLGDTSLFIALCAASSVAATFLVFHSAVQWKLVGFVFFATLFTYNVQRFIVPSDSAKQYTLSKKGMIVLAAFGLASIVIQGQLNWSTLILFGVFGSLSILYALPFFHMRGERSPLRNFPYVKLWLIVVVWVGATSFIPLWRISSDWFSLGNGLFLVQQFLFVAALTIPFDIRDYQIDYPSQKTMPMVFGVKKAQRIALLFLGLASLCVILNGSIQVYSYAVGAAYLLSFAFSFALLRQKTPPSKYYYLIYVDGMILLQSLLLSVTVFS